jgi:trk system potassium uptake protein TrkH
MHSALIARILGLLLVVFSFTMIPPVVVAWIYQDEGAGPFMSAFGVIFVLGLALWLPTFRAEGELQTREGFLVVTLFWLVLGLSGALPLIFHEGLALSFTDAAFESISGLTTTGASILSGIDNLPHSLLFYRQQLQWLGGMGVIVLAIAILPMLGVGGMQLYRAEIPGPMKESKLTPRIAETAKALWYIYLSLTIVCGLAYWWAGMGPFDAICYAFSTIATGGFAPHEASLAYFDNAAIDWIGAGFIFLASCNFGLHFAAWRSRSLVAYGLDPEFRFFVGISLIYVLIVSCTLYWFNTEGSGMAALRHSVFQVLSFSTGTGLVSSTPGNWPLFVPYLLVMASFLGGCAASTAGGMKVVRGALMFHQGQRELRRLIYPTGVFALRFGQRPVDEDVLRAVAGFVAVYILVAVVATLLLTGSGLDMDTAVSATAASLNNLGVGIAGVAGGYSHLADWAKWLMCLLMLLGRLEIFTLLVLFTPMFWRQ